MVLVREVLLSSGLTGPPRQREISLRVRQRLAPIENDVVLVDVSHQSQQVSRVQIRDSGQTTELSVGGIHPSSSAPTSVLSDFPSNRSLVFVSSATLLLLTQFLVCCIDRLNSPSTVV